MKRKQRITLRLATLAILCGLLIPAWSAVQAAAKTFNGTVNVNTASAAELTQIPGIGAAKAAAIVETRQTAKFTKLDDLLQVRGIGPKLLEKMTPYLTLSGTSTVTAQRTPGANTTTK